MPSNWRPRIFGAFLATGMALLSAGCAPVPTIVVRTQAVRPEVLSASPSSCPIPGVRFERDGTVSRTQGVEGSLDRCLVSFPAMDRSGLAIELAGRADPCRTGTMSRAWLVVRSRPDSLVLDGSTPSARADSRGETGGPGSPELRCRALDSSMALVEVVLSDSVLARTCLADDGKGFRRCAP